MMPLHGKLCSYISWKIWHHLGKEFMLSQFYLVSAICPTLQQHLAAEMTVLLRGFRIRFVSLSSAHFATSKPNLSIFLSLREKNCN